MERHVFPGKGSVLTGAAAAAAVAVATVIAKQRRQAGGDGGEANPVDTGGVTPSSAGSAAMGERDRPCRPAVSAKVRGVGASSAGKGSAPGADGDQPPPPPLPPSAALTAMFAPAGVAAAKSGALRRGDGDQHGGGGVRRRKLSVVWSAKLLPGSVTTHGDGAMRLDGEKNCARAAGTGAVLSLSSPRSPAAADTAHLVRFRLHLRLAKLKPPPLPRAQPAHADIWGRVRQSQFTRHPHGGAGGVGVPSQVWRLVLREGKLNVHRHLPRARGG